MKSQNILLHREDGVWTPKITDFGLSREILGDANITHSAIGLSYAYAAPEQIQNKKIYKSEGWWGAGKRGKLKEIEIIAPFKSF